ncbi:SDR family NAD(P)-dependent oxidoreductase [Actinosynnema sp. NPDC050801]|uniref:SDR family NAD(P)-dependent oxidoreductase n=1 Tax=unclassified Actinosynnema TaxID=2637065 RepID=UPI0033C7C62B
MTSVLVTGSADGIGRETAATLVSLGHRVVLHARNAARAGEALAAVPGADGVVVGDLASLAQTRELAAAAGAFEVVIHNAGLGGGLPERTVTEDGLELLFQVNVLAPYLLTALMPRPRRLVYLTSGLESQGVADLDDLQHERGPWNGMQAYSDSKLLDVVLAFAVARRWPDVSSNTVDPGWIKTRMGGPNATDELPKGADTPVWLATSDEPAATATGRYFKWREELRANPAAYDVDVQDRLLAACAEITGVELP